MQNMDTTQLTQMVNWLDEELRRERAGITKLQQLVERQTGELTEQSRQSKDLEGRLANTQAQLAKFARLDETLQQFKNEVVLLLDKRDEQRRKAQRETERLRMAEREAQSKTMGEVRRELQDLSRHEEQLRLREAEDRRLGELLMSLRHEVTTMSKDFDERARNLSYLTEQRAYDNKRIAGLQEENLTLLKRTEKQDSRLKSLEDRTQRHERHVQELLQFKTNLKREQTEWRPRPGGRRWRSWRPSRTSSGGIRIR
jgi:chromosome segregation ATPase